MNQTAPLETDPNFSYRGVYIWNNLQDHINIYSSYSTFSTALKTFLLSNDLNYRINDLNYIITSDRFK